MNHKKLTFLSLGAAALLGVLTGCNALYDVSQPKPGEISRFLPHHELLALQDSKFPFQYFYMKQNAKRYENIYVAPVNVNYLRESKNWEKFDKQLAGKLGQDVQKLADHMRARYVKEIKEYKGTQTPNVVDSPKQKNTAVMETAIVAIVPNKAELNALGLAGNILLPGISVIVARLAAGSVTIECIVRDGETGEILAMYSTTIKDQAAILNLKAMSWYGSAQRSIEKAAKDTATVFATRDYASIKRAFPIKLISL